MRLVLAVLAVAAPLAAGAQGRVARAPTGLTGSVSLAGGGELGLESGKAGVLEIEGALGFELPSAGLRPELAIGLGVAPDSHLAFRPGVRWGLPGFPVQLRLAIDAATARGSGLRWRWLLVGAAAEIRLTSVLGLYGELDSGAPLASEAGLPLLVRAGASFRF